MLNYKNNKNEKNSPAGNRTRVECVTGTHTNLYTTRDIHKSPKNQSYEYKFKRN